MSVRWWLLFLLSINLSAAFPTEKPPLTITQPPLTTGISASESYASSTPTSSVPTLDNVYLSIQNSSTLTINPETSTPLPLSTRLPTSTLLSTETDLPQSSAPSLFPIQLPNPSTVTSTAQPPLTSTRDAPISTRVPATSTLSPTSQPPTISTLPVTSSPTSTSTHVYETSTLPLTSTTILPSTSTPTSPSPSTSTLTSPSPSTSTPTSPSPSTSTPTSPSPSTSTPTSPSPSTTTSTSPSPSTSTPTSPTPSTLPPTSPSPTLLQGREDKISANLLPFAGLLSYIKNYYQSLFEDVKSQDQQLPQRNQTRRVEPCDNIDPGTVKELAIEIRDFNLTLTWELPENGCATSYVIYLDDSKYGTTQDLTFDITNIYACHDYNVSVSVVLNEREGSKQERSIRTVVPDYINYGVMELKAVQNYKKVDVTWELPLPEIVECVTFYNIIWWPEGYEDKALTAGGTMEGSTEGTSFEISPITGCITYDIMVYPVADPKQGLPTTVPVNISDLPMNPPKAVRNPTPDKTSVEIRWNTDTFADNMCLIQKMFVSCDAMPEDNDDLPWIVPNAVMTLPIKDDGGNIRPTYLTRVEGLSEYTNYTCYGVVTNTGGDSDRSDPVKFMTLEEVPSEPYDLRATNIESGGFRIEWAVPNKLPGIMEKYYVTIKTVKPLHYIQPQCSVALTQFQGEVDFDVLEYLFDKGLPDFTYTVSVLGRDGAGNGSSSSIDVITKFGVPEKPTDLNHNTQGQGGAVYTAKELIKWKSPCNPNGILKLFRVHVEGHYFTDDTADPGVAYQDNIFRHDEETNIDYQHTMSLKPAYLYSFKVKAVLEDGTEGEFASLDFTSPDGFPGAPIFDGIGQATEKSFEASWREPTERAGTLLRYKVTVTSMGALHSVPDDCIMDTKTYEDPVDPTNLKHVFSKALPNYHYKVSISAETSAGTGPQSETKEVSTMESAPEVVRDAEIEQTYTDDDNYRGSASVRFYPPCNTNGVFNNYEISYKASRQDFPDESDTVITTLTTYNIDVKPEYEYTVEVKVFTDNFSSSLKLQPFQAQCGVPYMPENLTPPLVNGTTTALFTLPRNAFDRSMGEIKYYAVFLIEQPVDVTGGGYGRWSDDVETWPSLPSSSKVYQITKNFWNPFDNNDVNSSVVHIGDGSGCHSDYQCNPSLKKGKKYSLIVRALTKQTYRDSELLSFETEVIEDVDLGLILGLVFGLLLAAVLVVFMVILWKRRKNNTSLIEEEIARTTPSFPPPVSIKKFVSHYEHLQHNYNVVKAQFTTIETKTKELGMAITYAVLPENKRKNRYTNILPYDETRVKLQIDEDDEICSDYINASFIKGYSGKVEYIATQGPLEHTTKDFWKMVVQENVTMIVMVSQFIEQSKEKCFKYFPNNHETTTFSDKFEVKCVTELQFANYCVRTLQVMKDGTQHTVIHLHFLEWPDFGLPADTDLLLEFCTQMRERAKSDNGLIAIHCSAGVGRTGTLIATDILLQTIEDHQNIDVFGTVLNLRRQRVNMVQTEKQYMFIHTCLRDKLEPPINSKPTKSPEPMYENLSIMKSKSNMEDHLISSESESAL